jgi:hypothetical protein
VVGRLLQPGTDPGQPGGTERPAFGDGHGLHRDGGHVGDGLHPGPDPAPAPGGHDPRRGTPGPLHDVAQGHGGRLERPAAQSGRTLGQIQAGQGGPPARVVEGDPLAPEERLPHRHPVGVGVLPVVGTEHCVDPVEEQPAGVARSAHQGTPRGQVGQGPQVVDLRSTLGHQPHHQGRAAHHQHVARDEPADHELLAEGIDPTGHQGGAGGGHRHLADGLPEQLHQRQRGGVDPDRSAPVGVPARSAEEHTGGEGGGEVDRPGTTEAAVGYGLGRPVARGIRVARSSPAQQADRLG